MADFQHSTAAPRRAFLRGLASLPLIGGSIALVGQPVAAAVPVTSDLILRYVTFLAHEHREALFQFRLMTAESDTERDRTTRINGPMEWFPEDNAVHNLVQMVAPSKRAAVILSAAGLRPSTI